MVHNQAVAKTPASRKRFVSHQETRWATPFHATLILACIVFTVAIAAAAYYNQLPTSITTLASAQLLRASEHIQTLVRTTTTPNNNKALFIIVGECFRTGFQASRSRDHHVSIQPQHDAVDSHIRFIHHVKSTYKLDIDVAIETYETAHEALLLSWYYNSTNTNSSRNLPGGGGVNIVLAKFHKDLKGISGLSQDAIATLNMDQYTFAFIFRIDIYLKPHLDQVFNPTKFQDKLVFPALLPYKEPPEPPQTTDRTTTTDTEQQQQAADIVAIPVYIPEVVDTMVYIPHRFFPYPVWLGHESWQYYIDTHKLIPKNDYGVMIPTYHDSDSFKDYNPLYYMVGRKCNNFWITKGWEVDWEKMTPKKSDIVYAEPCGPNPMN